MRHIRQVSSDLNIQPMMNLFMVLVPLLLMGAVFAEVTVFGLNLPTHKPSDQPAQQVSTENLELRVEVTDLGFRVVFANALIIDISLLEDGQYDIDRLYNKLLYISEGIISRGLRIERVEVSSQPQIKYDLIVKVMDCCKAVGFTTISISSLEGPKK